MDRLHPKRILIVRPHDQLGDFLLSTPAIDALRKRFPGARLGIVVRDYFADAVRMHPALDEVLVFYKKASQWTPDRIAAIGKSLLGRWDAAVVLSAASHSLSSDLLAVASGAKIILGSAGGVFPGCRRNFLYNLEAPDRGEGRHQTQRNLDIVRYIGADTDDLRERVHVDEAERKALAQQLFGRKADRGVPVVGLHVGANKIPNRWPVEKFAHLADRLHGELGADILLLWGPHEAGLADRFLRAVSFNPFRMPPSTLHHLAVGFSVCDLAVCNDTGIMHLAASVGTPLVALFGPTDPDVWKPVGRRTVAVRAPDRRIGSIAVHDVVRTVRSLLEP
jgi:ADP-heptose:LPS heptosyltransferase